MLSFELAGVVTAAPFRGSGRHHITLAESHGGIETLSGRNQPVQVISSRHQNEKGFRYTQKIDRLDMHRMAQSPEGGLQKTFALGWMGMDGCSDILEPRAHLERQAEPGRQFRNPGAHSLNAEQKMIVGSGDHANESRFLL